jgi:hypothetical protein
VGTADRPNGADGAAEVAPKRTSRRKLLLYGIAVVAVIGVAELATGLPDERTVLVRIREGEEIERVELVWHEGDEVVHRTLLGPPFSSAKSAVRLSDGDHRLELGIQRNGRMTRTERRVEVLEGAEEIVIDVP